MTPTNNWNNFLKKWYFIIFGYRKTSGMHVRIGNDKNSAVLGLFYFS